MNPQVAEIQRRTPMTTRYVKSELARTGKPALYHAENMRAWHWRQFELRFPRLAKLCGLFVFGRRIAFGG